MSICSDEINLLIQHYLQELGFHHSAFAFGCESKIPLNPISKRKVQPGSLVYLIQKGIMYSQMEAAADAALSDPSTQFAHQLNLLRANLRQSAELVDEICSASRRMKVLSTDQSELQTYYLNSQSSLVLEGHTRAILSSSWTRDSKYLATGSADGTVIIWAFEIVDNQTCIVSYVTTIENKQDPDVPVDITSLEWSSDGSTLAIGTFSGTLISFTLSDKSASATSPNDTNQPIVSLSFSPDSAKLLAGTANGTVFILKNGIVCSEWNFNDSLIRCAWLTDDTAVVGVGSNVLSLSEGHDPVTKFSSQGAITEIAADPRSSSFVVGDSSGLVVYFDKAGSILFNAVAHQGSVCAISCARIPDVIATGGVDGIVKVTNVRSQKIAALEDHSSPVYAMAFDPLGRYIASAANTSLDVWRLDDNALAIAYEAMSQIVDVSWSPSGRMLTVFMANGETSLIDFEQIC